MALLQLTLLLWPPESSVQQNSLPSCALPLARASSIPSSVVCAPVFTLSHTLGIKGVLGSDYSYNYTEASIYKRFWLKSWGKLDIMLKGGLQWEKVPYPLLIMPETNLSYILQDFTFSAINNMEFPTDRFLSGNIGWDLNGKIFNRIPLLKKLKWREFIGFRILWGDLTDKNNPLLEENTGSPLLMYFPEGSYVIDSKRPYMEMSLGIHNIFKLFRSILKLFRNFFQFFFELFTQFIQDVLRVVLRKGAHRPEEYRQGCQDRDHLLHFVFSPCPLSYVSTQNP